MKINELKATLCFQRKLVRQDIALSQVNSSEAVSLHFMSEPNQQSPNAPMPREHDRRTALLAELLSEFGFSESELLAWIHQALPASAPQPATIEEAISRVREMILAGSPPTIDHQAPTARLNPKTSQATDTGGESIPGSEETIVVFEPLTVRAKPINERFAGYEILEEIADCKSLVAHASPHFR